MAVVGPKKRAAAIELLKRRAARANMLDYTSYMMDTFAPAHHHGVICSKLEAVERGDIKRLIITVPPRHTKSLLSSEMFPSWYIGRNPDKQVIACSYSADLAGDFGRKVRNHVKRQAFRNLFPDVRLLADSQAAGKWNTESGGAYVSAGIGGSITGKGAHVAIIDDPIKNREEAESPVVRKKIWNWYTSTLYTRLMPGGSLIVIMTRWHHDDLVGRLLREQENGGDRWEVINLRAVDDDWTKALWPEWYPVSELRKIRAVIGSRDFEALYQQQPSGDTSLGFDEDWLCFYGMEPEPELVNFYIVVDPANEKKKESDYTSIWVIGLHQDRNYYLYDGVHDKLNLTERANTLFDLHREYHPLGVGYEQYGMQADIQHIESLMEARSYRFTITKLGGSTPKNDRIRRLVPLFENSRIWMPHTMFRRNWEGNNVNIIQELIRDEYKLFPVPIHDDMLDNLANIVHPDLQAQFPRAIRPRRKPTWQEKLNKKINARQTGGSFMSQ